MKKSKRINNYQGIGEKSDNNEKGRSVMADNKKYYYMKIKENFFESEELIILQNMPDGYLYSDILMKLYLRSLKNNGKLIFKDKIPYSPEVLAQVVRHQVGTVKQALIIFQRLGLIEIFDDGTIYMMDIQNYIGKSSSEGDRKRKYRKKIQEEKELLLEEKQEMGQMSTKCPDIRPPEIEIEIELDNNIVEQECSTGENDTKKTKNNGIVEEIVEEVIKYMNLKKYGENTSKGFKPNTKNTIKLIKSLLNNNYTKEEMLKVIDYKYNDFVVNNRPMDGSYSSKYFRPETLFALSNFEKYRIEAEDSLDKPKQNKKSSYDYLPEL